MKNSYSGPVIWKDILFIPLIFFSLKKDVSQADLISAYKEVSWNNAITIAGFFCFVLSLGALVKNCLSNSMYYLSAS